MPFLQINGVAVSVAVDSVTMDYVDAGGEMSRSPAGVLVGGPLVSKREWKMTTTPVPVSEFDAWVGLIEGAGHVISFDSADTATSYLWTSRGATPVSAVGTSRASTFPRHGDGNANIADGGECLYRLQDQYVWTLLFWHRDVSPTPGPWLWHAVTSDGRAWLNSTGPFDSGAGTSAHWRLPQDDEDPPRIGVLNDLGAGGTLAFDDMAILPFVIPSSWATSFYTFLSSNAWSALPRVTASGTFAPSSVTVRGKVTGAKVIRYSVGDTLTTGYALDFTLKEV